MGQPGTGGGEHGEPPEVRDAAGRADASPHHDHHPLAGLGSNQLRNVLQEELLLLIATSVSKGT